MPPFEARASTPPITARTASSGMIQPPASSLLLLAVAPARADCEVATDSFEAGVAVCARTGVPAIETASIAAKDAFLKLMSNSLLSWRVPDCHTASFLTTPQMWPAPEITIPLLPCCKGVAITISDPSRAWAIALQVVYIRLPAPNGKLAN